MEIIWLTENYPPNRGGMAQSCERIVKNLRKNGLIIHLIHFFGSDYHPVKRIEIQGSYTAFPVSESPALTLHQLYHFLSQNFQKTDALLAFGGYLPCLGLIPLSAWRQEKAWVAFRGNDFDQSIFSFNKQSALFDLINQADKILTVTAEKKYKIDCLLKNRADKVFFTPNGIDLEHWSPNSFDLLQLEELLLKKKKVRIGCIGQLKDKKGARFWLDALERSGVRDTIEMLWVGEIEPNLLSYIPESDFNFPFLDRTELLPYYLSCDFIAIPSFYDGMPNVLLEAMALGIPCIASNTGGMVDVIDDKNNGFLFHAGDVNSAAETIYYALSQQKSLPELKSNAQKTIADNFSSEMETKKWIEVLSV